MHKKNKKRYNSLAHFVISTRESLGMSQDELAVKSSLSLDTIQSIEQGFDLFLSTTTRQKLANCLKVDNKEIKSYEIKTEFTLTKRTVMDEIKDAILLNSNNPNFVINCPICGEKLSTRIAKLYDLEDNLILRPKAKCTKCPFQLID